MADNDNDVLPLSTKPDITLESLSLNTKWIDFSISDERNAEYYKQDRKDNGGS